MREDQATTEALEGPYSGTNGAGNGDDRSKPREVPFRPNSSLHVENQPVFEPVLNSEEAAALLNIHPKTLQKLARNGKVPGVRIGKVWAFRVSALNRWLEGKLGT